jgi:hypothetical protein
VAQLRLVRSMLHALTVAAFAIFAACAADSAAASWRRAEVYLVDWEVLTRVALSAERLRGGTHLQDDPSLHRAIVSDPQQLERVVRELDLAALRPGDGRPEDGRLLVDLFDSSGHRVTYYASRFRLATPDNLMKHPIGAHFRKFFESLTRRPNQAMSQPLHRAQPQFPMAKTHSFQASLAAISDG